MHRLGIGLMTATLLSVLSVFCSMGFAQDQGQALIEAAKQGDLKQVQELVRKGADVNAKTKTGWTALMAAAAVEQLEMTAFLIAKGAKVNAKDGNGRTALMYAAARGNIELVNLIVKEGADVDAQDKAGQTVLMAAVNPHTVWGRHPKGPLVPVYHNNLEVAKKLLVDGRVNVNAKDKHGWTALMCAVLGDNFKIVKLLLEKGAEVNAKDKQNYSALKLATGWRRTEIVELLKAHGAKE
jgi:ankyrin repeat protein